MSIILRASLATNEQQKRIMNEQFAAVNSLRQDSIGDMQKLMTLTGNAARTPADAYREFDSTSKIDVVPAGEFATLTRILQKSKSVNIGKEVYEYRKTSAMNGGQSSMSGQIGIKLDQSEVGYGGTVIPVHDKGFGRSWRQIEAMRADGYDALVDDAREAERGLMSTIGDYLWNGSADLSVNGTKWLGLKADPSVANATLAKDLAASATTAEDIRAEVARVRDILYITNNCTNGLRLGVSREIMSNWERVFSNADGMFGTIADMVKRLRGISEIYEDSKLVGNELVMYWDDLQGLHTVVGMGINTYAVPRQFHNSDFAFVKWAAAGFVAKTDFAGRKCALYGHS